MEMKYVDLKTKLKEIIVFSLNDIRQLDSSFYRSRLIEWSDKGYIIRLRRDKYMFSDTDTSESILFHIANRIYSPSYISLETALSYYGLIPETVYSITSVTTRKTNEFENKLGKFIYRTLNSNLFWGYDIVQNFQIAEVEKCILDYLYLNPNIENESDFVELRFNGEDFLKKYSKEKFNKYLKIFNNKALNTRVNKFMKFLKNA
ncbi:hypothetical protein H6762_04900 [Candidatus Nomurabacteria bacterium]|nr:hypothetical protein [Candidatus Nomurabacteria bacterium]